MIATFEIRTAGDEGYYFTFKISEEIILRSQFFLSKNEVQNGIEMIKRHVENNGTFNRNMSKTGQVYFTFRNGDLDPVWKSMMYDFASAMENDIALLKKHLSGAVVEDMTC
jgi:uncharacterized protein YegP (UPF0339 family)